MENTIIPKFLGEYRFLSNFHACTIEYEGLIYQSTEAAYQAAKLADLVDKRVFTTYKPSEAKKAGKKLDIRPDWEAIKYDAMYKINAYKYVKHPELTDKLIATGTAYLMEGNWWHDNYWGVCTCSECKLIPGQNNLGKVIMKIRQKIKDKIDAAKRQ